MKKLSEFLSDEILHLTSVTTTDFELEFDGGENEILLLKDNNVEACFTIEEFKEFIKELQEFVERLDFKIELGEQKNGKV